jgi:hypothetical protein
VPRCRRCDISRHIVGAGLEAVSKSRISRLNGTCSSCAPRYAWAAWILAGGETAGPRPLHRCAPAGAQDRGPDMLFLRKDCGFNRVLAQIWSGGLSGRDAPLSISFRWFHHRLISRTSHPRNPSPPRPDSDFETASLSLPLHRCRRCNFVWVSHSDMAVCVG